MTTVFEHHLRSTPMFCGQSFSMQEGQVCSSLEEPFWRRQVGWIGLSNQTVTRCTERS